jgi:hypothetical protein
MDIADYLKPGGRTAGHRELWRLLKTLFKQDNDADQVIELAVTASPVSWAPSASCA